MREIFTESLCHVKFDSELEVLEYQKRKPCSSYRLASMETPPEESWDLNVDYLGALILCKKGWPEGTKKVKEIADRLYDKIAPKVNLFLATRYDVCGVQPDMGRFLSGTPECMLDFETQTVRGNKQVDLLINCSASYGIKSDIINNRGATILAITEILHRLGCCVSVSIFNLSTVWNESDRLCLETLVHDSGSHLDVDSLAFTITHPAFFRRLLFGVQERINHSIPKTDCGNGYGTPSNNREGIDLGFKGSNQIYFPCIHSGSSESYTPFKSLDSSCTFILNLLKTHNLVEVNERELSNV